MRGENLIPGLYASFGCGSSHCWFSPILIQLLYLYHILSDSTSELSYFMASGDSLSSKYHTFTCYSLNSLVNTWSNLVLLAIILIANS